MHDDKLTSADGDPEVSRLYREMASERTPDQLDRRILEQAAAAASRDRKGAPRWLRPVAFAATVGLSLAIVLEITQSTRFDSPESNLMELPAAKSPLPRRQDYEQEEHKPAPIAGDNAAYRQQMVTDDEEPARMSTESVLPVAEDAALDEAKKETDGFADAIEASRKRMEDHDSRTLEKYDAGRAKTALAPVVPDPAIEPSAVAGKSSDAARSRSNQTATLQPESRVERHALGIVDSEESAGHCDTTLRSDVESWWECIEELRTSGKTDQAIVELEAFRKLHPDFMPAN